MNEEKKEIKSSEEDEKAKESEEKKEESKEEEQKLEEEESQSEGFEKDNESVPASKYNQALRKQREAEFAKRELEKKLSGFEAPEKKEKKEEVDEDDEDFYEEEKKEEIDTSKIFDEKLKPVIERIDKREENDKKLARTAFFESHPEYLSDSEKFQELLDEMDNSLNPNSQDDYYTQLEKAHRILSGDSYNAEIENKKKEMAGDASSGDDGADKGAVKDEFTAEDRKYMKDWNISEKGMRAYKKKLESGEMQILS